MNKFKELGLSKELLSAITSAGFSEPTQIQEKSIPYIVKGEDVLGESATGSGKTLAFGCGVVEQAVPKEGIQAKRERQDLLSLMMTGKQEHGSIPISEYKPTKAKNENAIYYSSPETERDIINMVQDPKWDGSLDEIKSKYGRVLGNYTINKGEDEKGKYISYYDVWDLNPYRGKSEAADVVTTVGQYLAGVKPAEVYGRVYY